jgi:hypothetical protein
MVYKTALTALIFNKDVDSLLINALFTINPRYSIIRSTPIKCLVKEH